VTYRYNVQDASGSMSFSRTEAQKDALVAAGGSVVNRITIKTSTPSPSPPEPDPEPTSASELVLKARVSGVTSSIEEQLQLFAEGKITQEQLVARKEAIEKAHLGWYTGFEETGATPEEAQAIITVRAGESAARLESTVKQILTMEATGEITHEQSVATIEHYQEEQLEEVRGIISGEDVLAGESRLSIGYRFEEKLAESGPVDVNVMLQEAEGETVYGPLSSELVEQEPQSISLEEAVDRGLITDVEAQQRIESGYTVAVDKAMKDPFGVVSRHQRVESWHTAELGKILEKAEGAPVHFDPETGGYYYTQPVTTEAPRPGIPGPGMGAREGSVGYKLQQAGSKLLSAEERFFTGLTDPGKDIVKQLEGKSKDLISEQKTVAGLGPYLGARATQAVYGVFEGLTFAVRPVKWGEAMAGVGALATSKVSRAELGRYIAEDPLRFSVDIGAAVVGGKLFGKVVSRVDAWRLERFYKKFPIEDFYLGDDLHLEFPEEITGQRTVFRGFKVEDATSHPKFGVIDESGKWGELGEFKAYQPPRGAWPTGARHAKYAYWETGEGLSSMYQPGATMIEKVYKPLTHLEGVSSFIPGAGIRDIPVALVSFSGAPFAFIGALGGVTRGISDRVEDVEIAEPIMKVPGVETIRPIERMAIPEEEIGIRPWIHSPEELQDVAMKEVIGVRDSTRTTSLQIQDPIQESVQIQEPIQIQETIQEHRPSVTQIQRPEVIPVLDVIEDQFQIPDVTPILDVTEEQIQEQEPVVIPVLDIIQEPVPEPKRSQPSPPPFFDLLGPRRPVIPTRQRKRPPRRRIAHPLEIVGFEEREYPVSSIEDLMGVGGRRAPKRAPRRAPPRGPPIGGYSDILLGAPPKPRTRRNKKPAKKKKGKPKKRRKKG